MLVFIGVVFFALFFTLMSVRLIFLKDGHFKGTCASQSPFLRKEGANCSLCGNNPENCEKDKPTLTT